MLAAPNPFDEFDAPAPPPVTSNPFDEFDAPAPVAKTNPFDEFDSGRALSAGQNAIETAFPALGLARQGAEYAGKIYEGYQNAPPAEKAQPPNPDDSYEIGKGFVGGLIGTNPKLAGDAMQGIGVLLDDNNLFHAGARLAGVSPAAGLITGLASALPIGKTLQHAGETVSQFGQEQLEGYKPRVPSVTSIRTDSLGNALEDVGSYAGYQTGNVVSSSVPALAAGIPAGLLSKNPRFAAAMAAGGTSYIQNFGDVYGSAKEDKDIAARVQRGELTPQQVAGTAAVAAIPMAALDAFGFDQVVGQHVFAEAKRDLGRRLIHGMASGAVTEGATEGAQEIISQWAQHWLGSQTSAYQKFISVVDNGLGGFFGGGATAGVTSAMPARGGAGAAPQPNAAPVTPQQVVEGLPQGAGQTTVDINGQTATSGIPAGAMPASAVLPAAETPSQAPAAGQINPPTAPANVPPEPLPPLPPRSLDDILADPRKAHEIRAEMEAAKNWQPTDQWQDVPRGANQADDLDVRITPDGQMQARLPPTPGTREAPVVVHGGQDLDAVAQVVDPDPTPAQKAAENYQVAHAKLYGLDLSIETPKGGTRVASDGSWSVPNFPAHYGRIKSTKAADGDAVDIFVGPEPKSPQVFVIDQIDPDSPALRYDEAKVMAGFPTEEAARAAYEAAFPDGSGSMRIGAVTPMSVAQFRSWVRNGDTTKPLAYEAPRAPRKAAKLGPLSLFQFLAQNGGIKDDGGELRSMGLNHVFVPGFGRLVRANGKPLDRAREGAVEAGYLQDTPWEGGVSVSTIPDLLDILAREHGGEKVFSQRDMADVADRAAARAQKESAQAIKAAEAEVRAVAKDQGINATDEEITHAARLTAQGTDATDALVNVVEASYYGMYSDLAASEPQAQAHAENEATGTDQGGARPAQASQQPAQPQPQAAPERPPGGVQSGEAERDRGAAGVEAAQPAVTTEPAQPAPAVEATPAGAQHVLPGAERISEGEQAQRKADQPLKPKVAQKPSDEGLFGDSHKQTDLVDLARKPAAIPGLVERIPGEDGTEVLIVKNSDGKRFNVVMRDTDAQQTVGPVKIVASLEQARRAAKAALKGPEPAKPPATAAGPKPPTPPTTKAPSDEGPSDSGRKAAGTAIEDFGEKIEGARKDTFAGFRDSLKEEMDVAAEPLSKSFPQPDYEKLAAGGVNKRTLAYIAIMRDMIPLKPRKSWKLQQWVTQVASLRDFARKLLDGDIDLPTLNEAARKNHVLRDLPLTAEAIEDVAPADLPKAAEYRISSGSYSVLYGKRFSPAKTFWHLEGPKRRMVRNPFSNDPAMDYSHRDTPEEAVALAKRIIAKQLEAAEASQPTEKSKYTEVNVYRDRAKNEVFLGFKVRSTVIRLKAGFDTPKTAREYLQENRDALQATIDEMRQGPNMRGTENRPRSGVALREGDVSPESFSNAFGFRGVQFGNYVEGGRRQEDLNRAFDALMDLADVLGIPPQALSLNGSLGLAFGARGHGGRDAAAAHYEPGQVVINLTKGGGPGSLAHEWLHALDNYFAKQDAASGYISERKRDKGPVREPVYQAWKAVEASLAKGSFADRAVEFDKARSKPYWSTTIEKAARAFERYVVDRMSDKGAVNDYLANIDTAGGAYPTEKEMQSLGIRAAYDHLFNAIETKPGDRPGTVALYSLRPGDLAPAARISEMFDALEKGPKNQWFDVPEGRMYLRTAMRPDLGGKVFDIANLDFDEEKRGQGGFKNYLAAIEAEAAKRGYAAVHVEQIQNPRLVTFLQREGYDDVPGFGRGTDTPSLYKPLQRGPRSALEAAKQTPELGRAKGTALRAAKEIADRYRGLTPAAQQRRADIEQMLRQVIRRVAGRDVKVAFSDRIGTAQDVGGWGAYGAGREIEGQYLVAERLIELSHGATDIGSTGLHEAFHDIEAHLFTPRELAMMIRETPRLRKIVQERWGYTDAQIEEQAGYEIRAQAFQIFADNRVYGRETKGLIPGIQRLFGRLVNLLREIRNGLAGLGFKTAEDVFGKAMQGEFAGRKARDKSLDEEIYAGVVPRAQYSFGGMNAAIAGRADLADAKMLSRIPGVTNVDVWKKTGWFKGVDGQWRFEIDDSALKFKKKVGDTSERNVERDGKLDTIIQHDKLFDAYPEARDINVVIGVGPYYDIGRGSINKGHIEVNAGDEETALNILSHELQHWIQDKEGFGGGNHPSMVVATNNVAIADIDAELRRLDDIGGGHNIRSYLEEARRAIAHANERLAYSKFGATPTTMRAYQNASGEQEATNVMGRRRMTAADRAKSFPPSTQAAPDKALLDRDQPVAISIPNEGKYRAMIDAELKAEPLSGRHNDLTTAGILSWIVGAEGGVETAIGHADGHVAMDLRNVQNYEQEKVELQKQQESFSPIGKLGSKYREFAAYRRKRLAEIDEWLPRAQAALRSSERVRDLITRLRDAGIGAAQDTITNVNLKEMMGERPVGNAESLIKEIRDIKEKISEETADISQQVKKKLGGPSDYRTLVYNMLVGVNEAEALVLEAGVDPKDVAKIKALHAKREELHDRLTLVENRSAAHEGNTQYSLRRDPVTAAERQQTMQGFLAKGQPIDRAMRIPFDIFGGLTRTGEWKPGMKLSDKAAKIITGAKFSDEGRFAFMNPALEFVRNGLIDRYNLRDLPGYVERERARSLDERGQLLKANEILQAMQKSGMGPEEAKVLHAMLTEGKVGPQDLSKLAEPIQAAIEQWGQEAVQYGLISPESFERYRGAYMNRSYRKHELDQNGLVKMVNKIGGSFRKRIIGNQLKGRGLFEDIPLSRLMRDVPDWHEGARGKPENGEKFIRLDEMSTQTEAEVGGEAPPEKVIRTVYWPADRSIPDRYSGFRNQGTWEVRGTKNGNPVLWRDFTKDERTKMGEILDARYTFAKTALQAAHDLSVGKFYWDIAQNEEWTKSGRPDGKVIDAAEWQRGNRGYLPQKYDWVRVPDTEITDTGGKKKYGALAGKYVREEIWRDLHEIEAQTNPNALAAFWRAILTQWKLNKTSRSPTVHVNNVMSNFFLMDLMDVRMQDLIGGIHGYATGDANYQEAFEHGAFGADMISKEIRENTLNPILKEIAAQLTAAPVGRTGALGKVSKFTDLLWTALKKADAGMRWAYQVEDEVFRMAAYNRRRQLGDTPKQAADAAREQFIDYDIHAPWIRAARNTVLPFISYTYRAVPIIANAVATRPWKIAKYAMLAYAANALAYALSGGDEDKERRSLREQEQGRTWLGSYRMTRMPFNDRNGNPMFLDARNWVPAGNVFDFGDGDIPQWMFLGGPLVIGTELAANRSMFTGQELFNSKTDDWWDRQSLRAGHAYKSAMPNAPWIPGSYAWDKIATAARGGTDRSGTPYSIPLATINSVGLKLKPQDVTDAMTSKGQEFDSIERALESKMRRIESQHSRKVISDGFYESTKADIIKKMERLNTKAVETFSP